MILSRKLVTAASVGAALLAALAGSIGIARAQDTSEDDDQPSALIIGGLALAAVAAVVVLTEDDDDPESL